MEFPSFFSELEEFSRSPFHSARGYRTQFLSGGASELGCGRAQALTLSG